MMMKDLERVIFTPGVNRETLTCDYYEVDNTVVVGTTGSGKTTTIQGIVNSIISSNEPDTYGLVYFDMGLQEACPFCNKNRVIPSMSLMHDFFAIQGDYYTKVRVFIEKLLLIAECGVFKAYGDEDYLRGLSKPKLVIVIDGFDKLKITEQRAVFAIMKMCTEVKFIIGVQSVKHITRYLYLFNYRVSTRISEEDSNAIMGCNLGYTQADKYGSCWFYDASKTYLYKKYNVPYMSKSLINRNLKVNAGYKGPENCILDLICDGFDRCELYVNIVLMKYNVPVVSIIPAITGNCLESVDTQDEYGLYPLYWELCGTIRNREFKQWGSCSIYNNKAVRRAIDRTTAQEIVAVYQYGKEPSTEHELLQSLKDNLMKEDIIYGKLDGGSDNGKAITLVDADDLLHNMTKIPEAMRDSLKRVLLETLRETGRVFPTSGKTTEESAKLDFDEDSLPMRKGRA